MSSVGAWPPYISIGATTPACPGWAWCCACTAGTTSVPPALIPPVPQSRPSLSRPKRQPKRHGTETESHEGDDNDRGRADRPVHLGLPGDDAVPDLPLSGACHAGYGRASPGRPLAMADDGGRQE